MEQEKQEEMRWNRHDYVTMSETGCKAAWRQAAESCPETEREFLDELFGGLPVPGIITRQENLKPGFVRVGWSSWRRVRDVRFRAAAVIPETAIKKRISPWEVFRLEKRWPEELSRQLQELKKIGTGCGIETGLIGSLGMEILTGLPYRDRKSDLDIIIREKPEADLKAFYDNLKNMQGCRLDAELQLPGAGGVKLADWMSADRLVLVKGLCQVELAEKSRWKKLM